MAMYTEGLFLTILSGVFHVILGSLANADEVGHKIDMINTFESYITPLKNEVVHLRSEILRMQSEYNQRMMKLQAYILQIHDSHEIQLSNMRQEFASEIAMCQMESRTNAVRIVNGTLIDVSNLRIEKSTEILKSYNETATSSEQDVENDNRRMTKIQVDLIRPEVPTPVKVQSVRFEHNPSDTASQNGMNMTEEKRQTSAAPQTVAFFAKLSNDALSLGINQTICFDNVVTNFGNGYDKALGIFRAPVTGIYLLSVTLSTYRNDRGHFGIFVNQTQETGLFVNGPENPFDNASQTIIVHLKVGSEVTIRSIYEGNKGVRGDQYSIFSGALLNEDLIY